MLVIFLLLVALLGAVAAPGFGNERIEDVPAMVLGRDPWRPGPWWACGMEVVPLQHPARFVYHARFHTGANGDGSWRGSVPAE